MSDAEDLDPNLIDRLGALGHRPVDPEVSARHVSMLAAFEPLEVSRRRTRQVLAGTLVAGAMFGGGGLAGALTGTLPGPVQDTAHSALAKVGIDVPKGDDESAPETTTDGDTATSGDAATAAADAKVGAAAPTEGARGTERVDCGAFNGNHGQYVSARPDDPATPANERDQAAKSECGKPVVATQNQPPPPGPPENARKPENPGKPDDTGKPAGVGRPTESGQPASVTRGRATG